MTWRHSYVSEDKETSFCVYDAPDPDAIREAAKENELPVDDITRVSVLDPHFYRWAKGANEMKALDSWRRRLVVGAAALAVLLVGGGVALATPSRAAAA